MGGKLRALIVALALVLGVSGAANATSTYVSSLSALGSPNLTDTYYVCPLNGCGVGTIGDRETALQLLGLLGASAPLSFNTGTAVLSMQALAANQLLGSLTAVAPSGLSVPSCSSSNDALIWTSGVGFGCNTISVGGAAFSALTGGTNTSAAMVVGSGASLGVSGSGTIGATSAPLSGITGLGTGVATFLATPSSANLAAAVTGETGSGALVFGTSPVLTTPNLGTPSAATLTNATGLPAASVVAGALANGMTATTQTTGDNTTKVATDAFVIANASGSGTPVVFTGTTAGSANAQTMASPTPSGFALTDQYIVRAKIGSGLTNTGAVTLAVNSTTASAVEKQTAAGLSALAGGELVAGDQYDLVYQSGCTCYVVTTVLANGVVNNATSATVTAAQWANGTQFNVTTSGQTLTLPVATTLASNGGIIINAIGNSVTLQPNAADGVNGGTIGASVTVSSGVLAVVSTVGSSGTGALTANPLTGGGSSGISGGVNGQVAIFGSSTTITSAVPFGTTGNSTLAETGSGGQLTASIIPPATQNALTDATTITVPAVTGTGAQDTVTLGGNHQFANPASFVANQYLNFVITENGTGGFTPTWGADYNFPGGVPVLNTAANAVNIVSCKSTSTSVLQCVGGVFAQLAQYTIATLPSCGAGTEGNLVYVTNGVASPSYNATVSTTGSTVVPVFCDGTNWRYH